MDGPAVLLIHGACHGSWCWSCLTPLLEERGYEVHTLDLPGRSPAPAWGWQLRLRDQAAAVVAAAAKIGRPTAALAHSMGGLPMSAAAELAPAIFTRLIYLSAYLPTSGDTLLTIGRRDRLSRVGDASRISMLRGFISVKREVSGDVFYQDCSAEQILWANARLVKEPLRPAFDTITLSDRFATIPRSYIRCTRDRVISIDMQDEMIAARPCDRVTSLDSSHSPFLSVPRQLADTIHAVS